MYVYVYSSFLVVIFHFTYYSTLHKSFVHFTLSFGNMIYYRLTLQVNNVWLPVNHAMPFMSDKYITNHAASNAAYLGI